MCELESSLMYHLKDTLIGPVRSLVLSKDQLIYFTYTKIPMYGRNGKEIPSGTFPSVEWIDFSNKEQDMGVTVAHFGIPSHEIRDNSIYLTLLRGVETLSGDGTKGPCIATPDAAEKRPYTFKYSLLPHNGDWRDASSYKEGNKLLT